MTEEMNKVMKEYNRMNTQLNQNIRAVSSWKARMDKRSDEVYKVNQKFSKHCLQRRAWASGDTRRPSILKTTTTGRGEAETEN